MTKDVIVSISGLQYTEDDMNPEPIEILTAATYYEKDFSKYIIYDEVSEDFSGTTKNHIKLKNKYVEISKKGATSVTMIFEEGQKNHTYYQTPYGDLLVAILANQVSIEHEEDKISVRIDYELEINEEPLADCKIKIEVTPKEQTNLTN